MTEEKTKTQNIKNKLILDPANIMGIFKIEQDTKYIKFTKTGDLLFQEDVYAKILHSEDGERTYIYSNGKEWSTISKIYFDKAKKIIKDWMGYNYYEIWLSQEKDAPVIILNEPLGIIIAPRADDKK